MQFSKTVTGRVGELKHKQDWMTSERVSYLRLTKLALAKLHELIDLPPLPREAMHAAELEAIKRKARLMLRLWHAHDGVCRPDEAFRPPQDGAKSERS